MHEEVTEESFAHVGPAAHTHEPFFFVQTLEVSEKQYFPTKRYHNTVTILRWRFHWIPCLFWEGTNSYS